MESFHSSRNDACKGYQLRLAQIMRSLDKMLQETVIPPLDPAPSSRIPSAVDVPVDGGAASTVPPICGSCIRPCRARRIVPTCCSLILYCSSSCLSSDRSRHLQCHHLSYKDTSTRDYSDGGAGPKQMKERRKDLLRSSLLRNDVCATRDLLYNDSDGSDGLSLGEVTALINEIDETSVNGSTRFIALCERNASGLVTLLVEYLDKNSDETPPWGTSEDLATHVRVFIDHIRKVTSPSVPSTPEEKAKEEAKRLQEEFARLQSLDKAKKEAALQKSLGDSAFKSKDYAAALEFYDKALSLTPIDFPLLSNRAAALSSLDRHAAALAACNEALTLVGDLVAGVPVKIVAKVHRRKGLAHHRLGQMPEALVALRLAQTVEWEEETARTIESLEKSEAAKIGKSEKGGAPLPPCDPSILYCAIPTGLRCGGPSSWAKLDWTPFVKLLTAFPSEVSMRAALLYKCEAHDGRTVLQQALLYNIPEEPYFLLSSAMKRHEGRLSFDVRESGYDQRTALHYAACYSTRVAVLIDIMVNSSDVNVRMVTTGRTPLDNIRSRTLNRESSSESLKESRDRGNDAEAQELENALQSCFRLVPPNAAALFEEAIANHALFIAKYDRKDMDVVAERPSELFFSYCQKFYKCRTEIEAKWVGFRKLSIELIPPIDFVELRPDVFDPSMRQHSLSGTVVRELDALNEVATESIPILKALLTDMLNALKFPIEYLHMAPLKGAARAEEKAKNDYSKRPDGPGLSWLFDMVRGAVICETPEEIEKIVSYLVALGCVVRLKNRFKTPTPGGFRDINMNLRVTVPGKKGSLKVIHICELQVHLKALKEYAKEIGSHLVYDYFRKHFSGGTAAVEKRLQKMHEVFGRRGGAICGAGDSGAGGGGGGGGEGAGKKAISLDMFVDQVCKEGNLVRMGAAADLIELMSEYDLAAKIRKDIVKLKKGPPTKDKFFAEIKLADLMRRQGKNDEALSVLESLLSAVQRGDIDKSLAKLAGQGNDSDNRDVLATFPMFAIGQVLINKDQFSEAQELIEKVRAIRKKAGKDLDGSTYWLAESLKYQKKYAQAQEALEELLASEIRVENPNDDSAFHTMHSLGGLYSHQDRHEEALAMFEKAYDGFVRISGLEHYSSITALCSIGKSRAASLMEVGRAPGRARKLKEAKTWLEKGVAGSGRLNGRDHRDTRQVVEILEWVVREVGQLSSDE